jgi:hypothetical protein
MLESVIFLETFPFVKWHYTELANVDSFKGADYSAWAQLQAQLRPAMVFQQSLSANKNGWL